VGKTAILVLGLAAAGPRDAAGPAGADPAAALLSGDLPEWASDLELALGPPGPAQWIAGQWLDPVALAPGAWPAGSSSSTGSDSFVSGLWGPDPSALPYLQWIGLPRASEHSAAPRGSGDAARPPAWALPAPAGIAFLAAAGFFLRRAGPGKDPGPRRA
jgi:hypothetical protein